MAILFIYLVQLIIISENLPLWFGYQIFSSKLYFRIFGLIVKPWLFGEIRKTHSKYLSISNEWLEVVITIVNGPHFFLKIQILVIVQGYIQQVIASQTIIELLKNKNLKNINKIVIKETLAIVNGPYFFDRFKIVKIL